MQASDSTWSANWQKTFLLPRTPPVALNSSDDLVCFMTSKSRSLISQDDLAKCIALLKSSSDIDG